MLDYSEVPLTQELHIIRAHLLYYSSLLEDFRKTVNFVRDTRNPALDAFPEDPKFSENLMVRECDNLVSEVGRLEMGRRMQEKRLKNVMNLVSAYGFLDSESLIIIACYRSSVGSISN